jgi:membrane protease subunit HflC
MSIRSIVLIILALTALMVVSNSVYVVMETERAVVLRFGRLADDNVSPGIHIKTPISDEVIKFDSRILTVDAAPESFFTVQQKRLVVDSFVKWRIDDVGTYYRATGGNEQLAARQLSSRVNDGLRNEFGTRTLHEVVSGQRDELMHSLATGLNQSVRDELGIEVVDVRVKRIDLPPEVSSAVFSRMAAEREQLAREYRSQGREEAEKIRADADRQRTIIAAEAYKSAELVRGDGDAVAANVYASAFNKNREFYVFTRSMQAYQDSFSSRADVLVLEPDGDFFRYMKSRNGGEP